MRVIGGDFKGRRLKAGRGLALRPTSDKVREAVFNILTGDMAGRAVLDLFAGTGALGIEALSRGAGEAVFVDNHNSAIKLIGENLSACGVEDSAKVIKLNLPGQLKRVKTLARDKYDMIFMDPPYGENLVEKTLAQLEKHELPAHGAIVVAEHSSRVTPEETSMFKLTDRREYSTTTISFYERVC